MGNLCNDTLCGKLKTGHSMEIDYVAAYEEFKSFKKAADAFGLPKTTFQDRYNRQKKQEPFKKLGIKSIEEYASVHRQKEQPIQTPPPKPLREKITTIVYFTDAHNQPCLPKDRFYWLSSYINDKAPDYIIDGGDFDDLQSLCRHERNDSWKGRFKPAFQDDLEAANEARQILHENIKIPAAKYVTLGNHEARLYDFENANPEIYGMMQHAYEDILLKYGWGITPYRSYKTIDNVDFTHVPMNGMNKPVGGKNPCNIISRDSTHDICFGHTHAKGFQENHKLGGRSVIAFNGGCFMPNGYVPDYAKDSQKRFWYGCHFLKIINGRLNVSESKTMLELEQEYS